MELCKLVWSTTNTGKRKPLWPQSPGNNLEQKRSVDVDFDVDGSCQIPQPGGGRLPYQAFFSRRGVSSSITAPYMPAYFM